MAVLGIASATPLSIHELGIGLAMGVLAAAPAPALSAIVHE
jgi:hypothetical protein